MFVGEIQVLVRGQKRHFFQQQERVANRGVVRGRCTDFGLGTAVPWKERKVIQGETKKKIWFIDKFFVWWSSYEMNLNKRDEHFLGIVMCSHWSIGYLETSKQPAVQKDLDQLYTIKRSWSRITWFVTSWVCHCCFSITFYGSKGVCPNIKTMAAFAETFMSHRMLAREEDILVVANFGFRNLAFHLGIRSNNIYHNLYLYDILLYGLLFS